jgi:dCTP diphosphatase
MKKKPTDNTSKVHNNLCDATTTIATFKKKAHTAFDVDRDWAQFHSLKNLSMNIATEAAELMEHFLWLTTQESDALINDEQKKVLIEQELADVFIGVVQFAQKAHIDLSVAFFNKMSIIENKYPVEKSKGSNKKYTEL